MTTVRCHRYNIDVTAEERDRIDRAIDLYRDRTGVSLSRHQFLRLSVFDYVNALATGGDTPKRKGAKK